MISIIKRAKILQGPSYFLINVTTLSHKITKLTTFVQWKFAIITKALKKLSLYWVPLVLKGLQHYKKKRTERSTAVTGSDRCVITFSHRCWHVHRWCRSGCTRPCPRGTPPLRTRAHGWTGPTHNRRWRDQKINVTLPSYKKPDLSPNQTENSDIYAIHAINAP